VILTIKEMKDQFRIRHKKPLIAWLKVNGFTALRIGTDGWPILTWAYVEQVLGTKSSARPAPDVKLDHLKGQHERPVQAANQGR
jgi:hypothetical protein